jgi:hypothetical protein
VAVTSKRKPRRLADCSPRGKEINLPLQPSFPSPPAKLALVVLFSPAPVK